MQSYGELLKKAREEKDITFEKIERDTSITIRYLQALENEDVDVFPGEPYLIGFLRNYADYLGLDSQQLVSFYKNKKIQESPVPEGLIEKHRPRSFFVILFISIIAVAALAVYLSLFFMQKSREKVAARIAVSKTMNTHSYTLSDKPLEIRVYKGDHIEVPLHSGTVLLTVADTISSLSLDTPAGNQIIDLSEELELDVDGDAVNDIIVYVSDVSSAKMDRGAEVRMLLKSGDPNMPGVSQESIPVESVSVSAENRAVVLQDNRAYPFTLNVSFRGACIYRYQKDNDNSVEDYYTRGDIVTITASNGVRVWMSNGNAAKVQIVADGKTYDIELGNPGEVLVKDIKWIKDPDGTYKIVVNDLD
ncbi:MAG: helix-turn-helix domain-containing protein [Treponema sp.]|jgi:cytoskeletal protein RodZ|nr:helix-turn-helix domain-containing protein [Treponema sp.]